MTTGNLVELFENAYQLNPKAPCWRYVEKGQWKELNWQDVKDKILTLTGKLSEFGVEPGDRVSILSKTRWEWSLADLAILANQGITVPIYESNTSEQAKYILENSQAKIIFVENAMQFAKIQSIWPELPQLKKVILIESEDRLLEENKIYSLREQLLQNVENSEAIYSKAIAETQAESLASIVYTSGTTGNPKGCMITHDNFLAEVEGARQLFDFPREFVGFLFLPLTHIFGRATQFFQIGCGFIHAYAESIEKLTDNIAVSKPHFMMSVPRIFEKIHTKTLQSVEAGSSLKKKIFNWSMKIGERYAKSILENQPLSFFEKIKYKIARILVFKKLHQKLGGQIEFFISGGAPLSNEVMLFFLAFGIRIFEGYGLTETTAAISANDYNSTRVGTVGKPVPGVQIRIADDGEILIKGRYVFKGYYQNPAATKEAIDKDGWFHSGDLGEIDSDGFLKITGRKKDIIITAGGKNIAPQNIENLMKANPYVSQFVVHGDRRKFLSALVTLDEDEIQSYAKRKNIDFTNYKDLVRKAEIYELVGKAITDNNKKLARYETIKKFEILPHDFQIESGELTPTLKIKRNVINQKYKEIFDRFYDES